jgi:hypothetical protein
MKQKVPYRICLLATCLQFLGYQYRTYLYIHIIISTGTGRNQYLIQSVENFRLYSCYLPMSISIFQFSYFWTSNRPRTDLRTDPDQANKCSVIHNFE